MGKGLSLVLIIFSFSLNAQQKEYEKKGIVSEGLKVSRFQSYTMDDRKPRIIYHNQQDKPIMILNGQETVFEMIKTLNPGKLESFSVEKGTTVGGVQTKDRMIITTVSYTHLTLPTKA